MLLTSSSQIYNIYDNFNNEVGKRYLNLKELCGLQLAFLKDAHEEFGVFVIGNGVEGG